MRQYQYKRPKQYTEAIALMEENPAYYLLAGGTDLLVRMKLGRVSPGLFIDVSDLPELKAITVEAGKITIGAAVTHSEICRSSVIAQYAPVLAVAAASVGSPQIRNRGTVGGNVGNASPAGDTIPVLLAYDAVVKVVGTAGSREVPLKEFFTGPGRTVLQPGELMTGFSFAGQTPAQAGAFEKLGKRKALSISVVNAAVMVELQGRIISRARIAMGAVAATPIRIAAAEGVLSGREFSDEVIARAAQMVSDTVNPIDDVRSEAAYRKKMAGVLTHRALEKSRNALF